MNSHDRLRLASAVSHTVPGAELHITSTSGELIVVSRHPAADLDPCAFRRIVVTSGCLAATDLVGRIDSISIRGAVDDMGGGIFSSRVDRREQRWIATTAEPRRVTQLLDEAGLEFLPDDAMHACVRPDSDLAVTLVAITANDWQYLPFLDEVASSVAAACFVEEICGDLGAHAPIEAIVDARIAGGS